MKGGPEMRLGANTPNFTSVFADIEKAMAQIRAHRAQLLEEGDR